MDTSKIRANNEIDDLVSILRCGVGKSLELSKLKFDKVIALADADSDGKHIELLLSTLMHDHLRPIVEAGQFYIALSPLYKLDITSQPTTYLNTEEDLAKFISTQLGEQFIISDEDLVAVKGRGKITAIKNYLKYQKKMEEFADTYSTDLETVEKVLLYNFDQETTELDLGKKIETIELETGQFTFIGFYTDTDTKNEYFLSLTTDDDFIDKLCELQDLLIEISEIRFVDKKSKAAIESNSFIKLIDDLLAKIKRNIKISRLKGLGEINAEELWETSLNPETRRLIRVEMTEDSEMVINNFMGKDSSYRKVFLKEVFKDTLKELE